MYLKDQISDSNISLANGTIMYDIDGRIFIKLNDGIYHFSKGELNEEWINKVNYYYPSDIKKLIKESWQNYTDIEEKKVQKQKIKK